MSELLTASITIFGGFVVFVLGQMTLKFLIEPIHKQSEIIGQIAHSLIFYANQYSNPGSGKPEDMDQTSKVLRSQAALLIAKTHVIKMYTLFEFLKLVPRRSAIGEAHRNLIGLSNSVYGGPGITGVENHKMRKEIEKLLNIKPRAS